MSPSRPYRARGLFYLVSTAIFVVAAAITVLYAIGYHLNLPNHRITKSGLLVLNSTPKNAYITINDKLNPLRTSARVKLEPGHYQVKIDQPGVIPWEKEVDVQAGQAVFDEDILLFAAKPHATKLTDRSAAAVALSQNGRTVAYTVTQPTGVGLWRADFGGTPEKLATLPATYGAPTSLAFSGDGSRVLVSTPAETTVTGTALPGLTKLPVSGQVRFAPGDRGRLVALNGSTLIQADISTQATAPLEPTVTAWTASPDAVYAVAAGQLIRRDLRTGVRKVIAGPPLASLSAARGGDAVAGVTPDGTLYSVEGDKEVSVTTQAEAFSFDETGQFLAYASAHELNVRDRKAGTGSLITRSSSAFVGLSVITGGHYVLYVQGGQVHAIATDGSNDQPVAATDAYQLANGPSLITNPVAGLTVTDLLPR